jgi:YidC/Oxa1 family membrane protein insertase
VRVDYVPKRERRSGATISKAAAPKVDVSNAISAEFTDFDEGPAKVKSAVESEFGDFEDGPAKVQEDGEDSSRGNRRGSRKKRRGGSR